MLLLTFLIYFFLTKRKHKTLIVSMPVVCVEANVKSETVWTIVYNV